MDLDTSGFYFGRAYDLETKQADPEKPIFYNPADLTTHGVITGMTGSGKTGMGIILLEKAALKGIPAILIDPKGDLTNHLLHFPDLLPADFAAWVDEDAARRDGKTKEQAGEEAAASWKKGLSDWGIDKTRLERLAESVHYAVYTPDSNSAIPVSILSSLKAPKLDWEENKEVIRENISSTVTALLGLVGFKDIDPVRSREHILLSNIFENAWSHGEDLDLENLILQAQNPPFEKLGVVPLSKFFPEKDRFELSMLLNNFLAAPAFETWLEGLALRSDRHQRQCSHRQSVRIRHGALRRSGTPRSRFAAHSALGQRRGRDNVHERVPCRPGAVRQAPRLPAQGGGGRLRRHLLRTRHGASCEGRPGGAGVPAVLHAERSVHESGGGDFCRLPFADD